ncbi:hypothetical protein [Curtobacterium sp. RRHDQ10]|uniref:hypothetical protein n=1 Tax=Curtobacterium phyllosphaerae TaxID=3413379 RepID=UPI003BEF9ED7
MIAASWSAVQPLDHLAVSIAAVLFLGAVAFTVPVFVGRRRRQAPDAVRWADGSRREDGAAWAADRVLRGAKSSCTTAGVVFPGLVRCSVGATVRIDLAAPTIAPPAPWTTTPDGRVWSTPMASLQAVALDAAPGDDFAVVVALGNTDESTVLADLRRAAGPIQFTGDAEAVQAVARRIVDQLHTDPWSVTTPVLSVGVHAGDLGTTAPVSLADAVASVQENSAPGLLVLARAPRGAHATALSAALALPGNRWAVLVLGRARFSRWSFEVSRDGTMTSPEFGELRWADIALSAPRETAAGDRDDLADTGSEPSTRVEARPSRTANRRTRTSS